MSSSTFIYRKDTDEGTKLQLVGVGGGGVMTDKTMGARKEFCERIGKIQNFPFSNHRADVAHRKPAQVCVGFLLDLGPE